MLVWDWMKGNNLGINDWAIIGWRNLGTKASNQPKRR